MTAAVPPSHDDHSPHAGTGLYLSVALALLVLTSFSYATHLPFWSSIMGDSLAVKRSWMMAVSCSKAMLVILFFMHLKWEANWKWVLTVPASLMSMFLVLMLVPDVGLRRKHASQERLLYGAELPPAAAAVDDGSPSHVVAPPQH